MPAQALVVIAHGSESLEAVTAINVLRRGGVKVTVASVEKSKQVKGTRGIGLAADALFAKVARKSFDLIVLPGGEAGAKKFSRHKALIEKLRGQRQAKRWTAAICAAPALVLSPHGLLDGKQATCYPAFKDQLLHYVNRSVVVDGHCITAQGPASALAFGLQMVEQLCGSAKRKETAQALLA